VLNDRTVTPQHALNAALPPGSRAEIVHRHYAERMAALVQVQRLLASTDATPEQLMDQIPDLALSVVPASGAVFELIDGDDIVLRAGSAAAIASNALGTRLSLQGSLSGEAIRLGQTVRCDDTESDLRVALDECRRFGLRSVLVTVVRDKSGPIGVLKLFGFEPGRFGVTESDSLELLAEALGAVIQRKRAEEALQRSLRNQAGIVKLQHRIASASEGLQAALELIAESAQELTGAEGASISDVQGDDMVVRAACGMAAGRRGARVRRGGSLAGLSLAREEILWCDDSELDPRVDRETCRAMGVRSVMIAPLHAGSAAGGALRVMSSRTGAFTSSDVGTLQILAEWLGVVMQSAAVTELLRSSEAQYRLLFAAHPVPMWVYDIDTLRFLAVNDSAVAQYGFSKDEFLTMTLRDIRSPEGNALLDEYLSTRAVPGKTVTSWEHRRKDGSIIDVEASDSTLDFGGRPACLVLAQDITERVRAERRSQKSEALLSIAGRAARVGGWSLDRRDGAFSFSDELCVIHDLPAGSTGTVQQAIEFYAPQSRAAMFEAVQRCRIEGVPYDLELEVITARDRHIWVRTVGQPVRDSSGAMIGAQGAVQDITERKQTEEKVRALAANLTTTLESITDAFYTLDHEWRFTYVNPEAERLFQRSRGDLIGRTLWDEFPDAEGREIGQHYRRAIASNCSVKFVSYKELWNTWFEINAYPSESGLTVYFRDVSERHIAQEALRSLNESLEAKVAARTAELESTNLALVSKEEEIRSVVEHMADCVITFSDDGVIRSANSKVEAIFGHMTAELVGGNISVLVPALGELGMAHGRSVPRDAASVVERVGHQTFGLHRGGDSITLDVAISDYRIHGQRLWTAILRDIGDRVRIMADLEQARNSAEEASRAKSAFVATMSHEIRTPMNGVIGMIDVLHQTDLAPDQERMLGVARDSAHSLLAIIEDILDFSKIEAGRIELERLPISVAGVVRKVCDLVRGMAIGKGVELVAETDPELPGAVWGDALRLRQVLVNLLGNAIKFSAGRAGARVSVRASLSECVADRVNLKLEIEDNGIGMDAGTVERLFVPFSQADASTTRRFGGTGLGLAISHHLVQLMGGYIEVRSKPDFGSVFTVHLPFFVASSFAGAAATDAGPSALAVPSSAPDARPAEGSDVATKLVLVAEDNEINQQVITQQLKHLGFAGEVAVNGRVALALWRTGRFAILLTDLQMPEMDGYELTAAIRTEEGGGSRIPIIALTANALKEEETHCKSAGMDGYLTKPVQMARLGEALRHWLGQAGPGMPSAPSPLPGEQGACAPSLPRRSIDPERVPDVAA
jgi:PAS domain S-box-containing protein